MEKNWNENDDKLSRFASKCNVLLLADVLEKFRDWCLEDYGLCPSRYLSAPALSWDAMLSMTKVKLDFISNVELYFFLKKKEWKVVFLIFLRYNKANNKYLISYNPKNPTKYFTYLDKNNLYGYAMSKSPPTGEFKWLDPAKVSED